MDQKAQFNKMLQHISTDKGIILAHRALMSRNNTVSGLNPTSLIYLEARRGIIWSNNYNRVKAQILLDKLVILIKEIYFPTH